ncbi:MAG: hypothetical protein JSS68_09090 [Actinobacteria bacterium]|nr:hypothetical protein [Actinomycetota bacterium]
MVDPELESCGLRVVLAAAPVGSGRERLNLRIPSRDRQRGRIPLLGLLVGQQDIFSGRASYARP